VDVLIDPGFKEDMYVAAIESKPLDPQSFKVVHHFTTNLVEDPEEDPVGLFLNEYALGKNGDNLPAELGPPDQGRDEDQLQPAPESARRNDRSLCSARPQAAPKGQVPKYVAFTQHMGDVAELDIPAGAISRHDGYFRLPAARAALFVSSRTCTTAARRSAWKPSIRTFVRIRLARVPRVWRRSAA